MVKPCRLEPWVSTSIYETLKYYLLDVALVHLDDYQLYSNIQEKNKKDKYVLTFFSLFIEISWNGREAV